MNNIQSSVVRLTDLRAADVRDRMNDVANLFADQLSGAARNTERYVRANPWTAAGAVALAGVVAGLLLSRSRRAAEPSASAEFLGG